MNRPVLSLALAAVVLLAGCSTLGFGGGTATETPEPTPAGPLPPGVDRDGDVNETAVARATFAAMNETAHRVRHRNGPNRTVVYRDGDTSYVRKAAGGATWASGNLSVTNETLLEGDLGVSYESDPALGDGGSGVAFALAVRLGTMNLEWAGTRTVDGADLHVLEMTDAKNLGESMGVYTGTVLVDDRGRIHRLAGEVGENESAANRYRFEFEWGIDAVPRPSWVGAVPHARAGLAADGAAVRIRVTGGSPIPAGTELTFQYGEGEVTVALDEPLAPGETAYVAVRRADGEVSGVLSRDPPSGDDLVDLSDGRTGIEGRYELDDGRVVVLDLFAGSLNLSS